MILINESPYSRPALDALFLASREYDKSCQFLALAGHSQILDDTQDDVVDVNRPLSSHHKFSN